MFAALHEQSSVNQLVSVEFGRQYCVCVPTFNVEMLSSVAVDLLQDLIKIHGF